jgi:hypothetical protein
MVELGSMTAKVMCKRADSRHHAMMSVHLLFAAVPFRFRKVQPERMKLLARFVRQPGRAQQSVVMAKVNNGELQVKAKCLYCSCMARTGRRWVELVPSKTGLASASVRQESLVMQAYPPPNALKSQTYHLTLTLTSTYNTKSTLCLQYRSHSLPHDNSTDDPRCSTLPAPPAKTRPSTQDICKRRHHGGSGAAHAHERVQGAEQGDMDQHRGAAFPTQRRG